jgi:hypothetical protein
LPEQQLSAGFPGFVQMANKPDKVAMVHLVAFAKHWIVLQELPFEPAKLRFVVPMLSEPISPLHRIIKGRKHTTIRPRANAPGALICVRNTRRRLSRAEKGILQSHCQSF